MNYKGFIYLLLPLVVYCIPKKLEAKTTTNLSSTGISIPGKTNMPPIAVNDSIVHFMGCGRNLVEGNVLTNDYSLDDDEIALYFIDLPEIGVFSYQEDGSFELEVPDGFEGLINFEYYINDVNIKNFHARGEVFVFVYPDNDCDNVADEFDLDNDNDGLLNVDEGNGSLDSDRDGISDDLDIDSDNDGITDNVEWQKEDSFIPRSAKDLNKNGWDDTYDLYVGGIYYSMVDTDSDGMADNIDKDSDEDGISDLMESKSFSVDTNEGLLLGIDSDKDGLDDIFDNVECWLNTSNVCGSNAVLKDSNNNGIRDWRDFWQKPADVSFYPYPNPGFNYFKVRHFDLAQSKDFELNIYDLSGCLLFSKNVTQNEKIDVSDFERAIYILTIVADGNVETQKFVKQ